MIGRKGKAQPGLGEVEVSLCRGWVSGLAGVLAMLGAAQAQAPEDLSAGKSPSQMFASDCSACHKSPQGLAKGSSAGALATFLREHYTASRQTAAALAGFLVGAGPGRPGPAAAPVATPGPNARHGAAPAGERPADAPAQPRPPARVPVDSVETAEGQGTAARPRRPAAQDRPKPLEGQPTRPVMRRPQAPKHEETISPPVEPSPAAALATPAAPRVESKPVVDADGLPTTIYY
jgi:hypothetical protein